jgi:hypothetical protein
MKRLLISTAAALALTGCASIFNGQNQPITIKSVPEGATVVVSNRAGEKVHTGQTPVTVTLQRGAGYFKSEIYKVVFTKAGFAPREITIESSLSGWYFGNILFGGLIGMIGVDPATGAMYTFPDSVNEALVAEAAKTSKTSEGLTLVSMDSLSPATRAEARLLVAAR